MEKRIERNPFGDNHSVNVQGTSKTVGRCEHPLVCRSRSHNTLSKQLEGSANGRLLSRRAFIEYTLVSRDREHLPLR